MSFSEAFYANCNCVATGKKLEDWTKDRQYPHILSANSTPLLKYITIYVENWSREPNPIEPFDVPDPVRRASLSNTANKSYWTGNLNAASGAALLNYYLDRNARIASLSDQIETLCLALRFLRRSLHLDPPYVEALVVEVLANQVGRDLKEFPRLSDPDKYALIGELLCWLNEHGDWTFSQAAYEAFMFDGAVEFKRRASLTDYQFSGFLRQAAHAFSHTQKGSAQSARILDAAEAAHGSAQNFLGTANIRLLAAQAQSDRRKLIAVCESFAKRSGFNPLEEFEPISSVTAELPTLVGFSAYINLFLPDTGGRFQPAELRRIVERQTALEKKMDVDTSLVVDYYGTIQKLKSQDSPTFANFFLRRIKKPLSRPLLGALRRTVHQILELS